MPQHAILFVTPFCLDTRAVNLATGRHGFGHIALYSGIRNGTTPMVLDSSVPDETRGWPGGVSFRPLLDMTRGKPYDTGGLFRGRRNDEAFTCSGLICCILPAQLEQRCRELAVAESRPVSPNTIARVMGVPKWNSP